MKQIIPLIGRMLFTFVPFVCEEKGEKTVIGANFNYFTMYRK